MKISQFFNLLDCKSNYNYYIKYSSEEDFVHFNDKEINFVLKENDFEIAQFELDCEWDAIEGRYSGLVDVFLYLKNNDLKEILRIKEKREKEIEKINEMIKELELKKLSL